MAAAYPPKMTETQRRIETTETGSGRFGAVA